MPTYRDDQVECHVLTFKEGMLSAIAHDLKIAVDRCSIAVGEDGTIEATFDATSLRVVCARKDGRDDPSTLSASDKKKIGGNVQKDVLHTKRHPEVRFVSKSVARDGDRATITGELTLHGQTRAIAATATRTDGHWETEVPIHQPDFGIKPYSAMLGTLKVQPTVRVRLRVPE